MKLYFLASETEIDYQIQTPRQGDSKKNHGRMDSIRQTPWELQWYHWNLLEEISIQLMRTSSNDIRRGNMGTRQSSKDQASNRTNKYGNEYAKHHINGQKTKIWV